MSPNILYSEEQILFINLLLNELRQQKENKNIKSMNIKLFRAPDNEYSLRKFHKLCVNKGAT